MNDTTLQQSAGIRDEIKRLEVELSDARLRLDAVMRAAPDGWGLMPPKAA